MCAKEVHCGEDPLQKAVISRWAESGCQGWVGTPGGTDCQCGHCRSEAQGSFYSAASVSLQPQWGGASPSQHCDSGGDAPVVRGQDLNYAADAKMSSPGWRLAVLQL